MRSPIVLAASLLTGCYQIVVPFSPDGAGGSDAAATEAGATDSGPLACLPPTQPLAPAAEYGSFPANCETASCEPGPSRPHIATIEVQFACMCDPTDPVANVTIELAGSTAPAASYMTTAAIMGCEHPGYRVNGLAFSTDCVVSLAYATFASPWNVLVADSNGRRSSAYLDGPSGCGTRRFVCHDDPTGQFSYRCE